MLSQTLILLKPDTLTKKFVGKVISRFEDEGFLIQGFKMIYLHPELLKEHYAHIADKPFYPEVEEFMGSAPVVALVLEGENAVERVREMLGVTDSRKADAGTIRAEFGVDQMINVAHASDSDEAAAAEIKRFFKEDELYEY